ncbi:hypothetical protein ANTQUA_LOCUS6212 [Anthophora quadrimaculata]
MTLAWGTSKRGHTQRASTLILANLQSEEDADSYNNEECLAIFAVRVSFWANRQLENGCAIKPEGISPRAFTSLGDISQTDVLLWSTRYRERQVDG